MYKEDAFPAIFPFFPNFNNYSNQLLNSVGWSPNLNYKAQLNYFPFCKNFLSLFLI